MYTIADQINPAESLFNTCYLKQQSAYPEGYENSH